MKIQLVSESLRRWIRTAVPIIVGSLISYLLSHLSPATGASLLATWTHGGFFALLMAATSAVYAGAFIWLEKHFKWASAFLGALPKPAVVAEEKPTSEAPVEIAGDVPAAEPASAGASSQAP
jgi:hypothetical protein